MQYLVLVILIFTMTLASVFKQQYNDRCKGGTFFFNCIVALVAMAVFVVFNRDWNYSVALLPYSAGFATAYASASIFALLAIRYGSFGKTSLIISFSLLIPTLYGLLFLDEALNATKIVGLVLLVISLVLTNYEKDSSRVTVRWVIFVILAFVGNGMCSTVQKMEQVAFPDGVGKDLFMIVALAISATVMLICALTLPAERAVIPNALKKGWLPALLGGIATGLTNYLATWLNPRLPASVLFPVLSAGGIVLSFLYSTLFLKERFGVRQTAGFAIGVVSIVLLNL